MRKLKRPIRLFTLVLVAALAAGCGERATPTPMQTPPPATSTTAPEPTETAVPTPSATTPPATPSPSPTPPVETLSLQAIHMFTVTDGWADGSVGTEQQRGVFRTADGGKTWLNATPTFEQDGSLASSFFLDLASAWVAARMPGPGGGGAQTVQVFSTADGGQNWAGGLPFSIGGGFPGNLDFVDAQHGWLMVGLGVAAGSEAVALYATDDGGGTWERVMLASGLPEESTPGALPFGCNKSGVGFANASTGWATGFCPGGDPFFFMSQDGGRTWQRQTLPPPAELPAGALSDCQCEVSPPTFTSSQTGYFTVQGFVSAAEAAILYVTQDAGATWQPRILPVNRVLGSPEFVDAQYGWVTDGQTISATQDGGQTWLPVSEAPSPTLQGNLDFISPSNGWATSGRWSRSARATSAPPCRLQLI